MTRFGGHVRGKQTPCALAINDIHLFKFFQYHEILLFKFLYLRRQVQNKISVYFKTSEKKIPIDRTFEEHFQVCKQAVGKFARLID